MVTMLCGCKTYEDMIPEELGKPEGLWLYRGNERMRSDGSESERLLKEITLGGVSYSENEYTIDEYNIVYCTDTKTIFYGLGRTEDDGTHRNHVVMYDYSAKTAVEIGEFEERQIITASETYVFLCNVYNNSDTGTLYTHRGELVAEGLKGHLLHDFVGAWKYYYNTDETTFTYWRNGETHSVTHVGWGSFDLIDGGAYDGRYYVTRTREGETAYVLDLETEELREYPIEEYYAAFQKEQTENDGEEYLNCGEYTFWVETVSRRSLFGRREVSYLYRRHGDRVEIMQYKSLNVGDALLDEYVFYEDILDH